MSPLESEPPLEAANLRRSNRYSPMELAGAFGDLGTLIPFTVGYIAVVKLDPAHVLFAFGLSQILVGLIFKTPIPVQPMKAIGGAAIAAGGSIGPAAVAGAGLFTGLIWLLLGTTRAIELISRLAARPVVRGIMLGLGLAFMSEGAKLMWTTPWLGGLGFVLTFALLAHPRVPAMFALLVLGALAAVLLEPERIQELLATRPGLRLPHFSLAGIRLTDLAAGALVLGIPQLPLTVGNAIVAMREKNNALFPDRPVTDRALAISHGLINLFSAAFGGIPLCHGAGGMAGHVRFGARTGGALVMLGAILLGLALFFSDSVGLLFQVFPKAILGVILFFAGADLALTIRDIGDRTEDVYLMLVVAGFALWNMGAAFLVGVLLHLALSRGWWKA